MQKAARHCLRSHLFAHHNIIQAQLHAEHLITLFFTIFCVFSFFKRELPRHAVSARKLLKVR